MTTTALPPLFPLWPDGAQPIVEAWVERTHVETAELTATPAGDAPEYRRPFRAFPRLELTAQFVLFDDERSALAALEIGSTVLLPVWTQRLVSPAPGIAPIVTAIHPLAGNGRMFLIANVDGSKRLFTANGNQTLDAAFGVGDYCAYPVVTARLDDDTLSIESTGTKTHRVSLKFTSDDPREPVSPVAVLTPDSELLQPDGAQALKTDVVHNATNWDNGNTRTWSLRYTKRNLTLTLVAGFKPGEAQQLRSFLLSQRGRWKAFRLTDPRDGVVKLFRQTNDTLTLSYTSENTLTVTLTLTEVSA